MHQHRQLVAALLSLRPEPSFSTLTEVKDENSWGEKRESHHSVGTSEVQQLGAKEGKIFIKALQLKG